MKESQNLSADWLAESDVSPWIQDTFEVLVRYGIWTCSQSYLNEEGHVAKFDSPRFSQTFHF